MNITEAQKTLTARFNEIMRQDAIDRHDPTNPDIQGYNFQLDNQNVINKYVYDNGMAVLEQNPFKDIQDDLPFYIHFSIEHTTSPYNSFSTAPTIRRNALIVCRLYVPDGMGVSELREVEQTLLNGFENRKIFTTATDGLNEMVVLSGVSNRIGRTDNHPNFQINLVIDFYYEEKKTFARTRITP